MRREELAHILRSAARITDDPNILIIGSQAILASYPERDLPEQTWVSIEADLTFFDDPGEDKALMVEGAIGEDSEFHQSFGYYGQGVSIELAILPDGWRDRVVGYAQEAAAPAKAYCLDRHDLVISKLAVRREKDYEFSGALIEHRLVDIALLRARAEMLPDEYGIQRVSILEWLDWAQTRFGI
jgi:hypothetical protein